jgi:LPXTG-motif cell wall-anchored protein
MKRIIAILTAVLIGVLTLAGPALAAQPTQYTNVVSTPDDTVGGAPWARDTFNRVTTTQKIEGGIEVTIWDSGTFVTPSGVKGTISGGGTWTITGGTLAAASLPASIDRSGETSKGTFTGEWWKRVVTGGESASFVWEWTYKSSCWNKQYEQTRTEGSTSGAIGGYPSKVCPAEPSHSASPSPSTSSSPKPSPSASHSSTPKPSTSVSPSPSASATPAPIASPTLPITGAPIGFIVIGGALLLSTGAALVLIMRRRKVDFTA